VTGLLLINLGTPASPSEDDVRAYLREFLSDPRVLDGPAWRRKLILNLFILPRRPRESAKAYSSIWTDDGSPIMAHSLSLREKVRERLSGDTVVEIGMRYGSPSIRSGILRLLEAGAERLILFPLYPQYSAATTESCVEEANRVLREAGEMPPVTVVPPFYDHPAWLSPLAARARAEIGDSMPGKVIMSFHGLPERQVRAADRTGNTCLATKDCCATIRKSNAMCYRAQCFATARSLTRMLDLPPDRVVTCFQSRLGRVPWIRPYTDEMLALHGGGGGDALVLCPSFVADCLETLEELGMRGAETWSAAGGGRFTLAPCVNDDEHWADGVLTLVRESCDWL
jgi:ferrochelatase